MIDKKIYLTTKQAVALLNNEKVEKVVRDARFENIRFDIRRIE